MWAQSKGRIFFVSNVVFLRGNTTEQPTICSDSAEISRLLHYRLEVIEAALLQLIALQGTAAATPHAPE